MVKRMLTLGSKTKEKLRVALKTPIERGSDARFGGVHFSRPPHFGPLGTYFGVFLLNLGFTAPSYSRKPSMRSSKAPLNQKNKGRFYLTPTTPPELGLRATLNGGF